MMLVMLPACGRTCSIISGQFSSASYQKDTAGDGQSKATKSSSADHQKLSGQLGGLPPVPNIKG